MRTHPLLLALFAVAGLLSCAPTDDPMGPTTSPNLDRASAPPVVEVPVGGVTARFWPFASSDLATPDDPINLVFGGRADPLNIRNALLGLNGQRGAPFPPVFPFDCTWSDAIGGLMASFDGQLGWAAGAVQLQCGSYGPIRFHLRLFRIDGVTVGNAHFEVIIPGTADHQVLSWELAEQLVTFDLARTGLLGAAPAATAVINPAPTHRAIPAAIYDGLPSSLRTLIGGPAPGGVDVGIANDGRAAVLQLAGDAAPSTPNAHQELTLSYGQVIPKPFCSSGPSDFVLVEGPVTLVQDVAVGEGYRMTFRARGQLTATPIDVVTGQPTGSPLNARVLENQVVQLDTRDAAIRGTIEQVLAPSSDLPSGSLQIRIAVGGGRPADYKRQETCPTSRNQ